MLGVQWREQVLHATVIGRRQGSARAHEDEGELMSEPRSSDELRLAFERTLTSDERALLHQWQAARRPPELVWPPDRPVPADRPVPPVTIYTLPDCAACHAAEAFLAARGASATVKDVRADRAAARELVRARRGVPGAVGAFPLIVIGDEVIVGFDPGRLRRLLLDGTTGRRRRADHRTPCGTIEVAVRSCGTTADRDAAPLADHASGEAPPPAEHRVTTEHQQGGKR